eukprot:2768890-Rhodomonas_salina.3
MCKLRGYALESEFCDNLARIPERTNVPYRPLLDAELVRKLANEFCAGYEGSIELRTPRTKFKDGPNDVGTQLAFSRIALGWRACRACFRGTDAELFLGGGQDRRSLVKHLGGWRVAVATGRSWFLWPREGPENMRSRRKNKQKVIVP